MTSWLNQERIFPLIGTRTPLDVEAVLSSMAVGLGLAFMLDRIARQRRWANSRDISPPVILPQAK
jgi:hypothetical protein